jgi:hypothetical protein
MTMTLEQLPGELRTLAKDLRKSKMLPLMADKLVHLSRVAEAHLSAQAKVQAKVQVTDEDVERAIAANEVVYLGNEYTLKSGFRAALESFAARLSQGAHEELCEDEGCPHHGIDHVCVVRVAQSSGNSGEVAQGEAFQLSQGFVARVTTDDAKEPPVMGAGSHDSIKRIAEEMVHACKVVRQGDGEFTHDAVDDWAHRIMCFANYTHPAERAAVPEGWVMVPCVLTMDMHEAARKCAGFTTYGQENALWRAFLSAAPTLAGKGGAE